MKLTKEIAGAVCVLAGVGLLVALGMSLSGCDDGCDWKGCGPDAAPPVVNMSGCQLPPPPDAGVDALGCAPGETETWLVPGQVVICQ